MELDAARRQLASQRVAGAEVQERQIVMEGVGSFRSYDGEKPIGIAIAPAERRQGLGCPIL